MATWAVLWAGRSLGLAKELALPVNRTVVTPDTGGRVFTTGLPDDFLERSQAYRSLPSRNASPFTDQSPGLARPPARR